MSLIPKFFMDAVLSIGVRNNKGKVQWIGTGFFVMKRLNAERYQPFLVSNKHVLVDKDQVVIRMKESDSGNIRILDVPLKENETSLVFEHPHEDVDIAVVLLNGSYIMKNKLQFSAFDIDEHTLTSEEFLAQGGDEGSFIYMLGYPMGLVDVDSNSPICRSGCVARMSKGEIDKTKKILLDIQNFPGNSGSPIISKPEVVSISGTKALGKCALIGIVNSYIVYNAPVVNNLTKKVEIRSENSGIANANPAEFIKEVVEYKMEQLFGKDYQEKFASLEGKSV